MISWPIFATAFALFFATHTLPVRPKNKAALQRYLGARGFTLAYSTLSLAMLAMVITATKLAPYVPLWPQMPWQHYVVAVGMFGVCLLLALAIGQPNPFSFGGSRNDAFVPERPGIVRLTRHPLLAALALWAALHLLPNGDLAHVIMFGVFFVFAVLGRKIIDRRTRRLMGIAKWEALLGEGKSAPLTASFRASGSTLTRVGIGALAFVLLIAVHPVLLGVAPLPYPLW